MTRATGRVGNSLSFCEGTNSGAVPLRAAGWSLVCQLSSSSHCSVSSGRLLSGDRLIQHLTAGFLRLKRPGPPLQRANAEGSAGAGHRRGAGGQHRRRRHPHPGARTAAGAVNTMRLVPIRWAARSDKAPALLACQLNSVRIGNFQLGHEPSLQGCLAATWSKPRGPGLCCAPDSSRLRHLPSEQRQQAARRLQVATSAAGAAAHAGLLHTD